MRARRPLRSTARHGLLAAVLAVLALFVQALIPAAAIAHDAANGAQISGPMTISLCTGDGEKTLIVGGQPPVQKHFMGLHCTACAFANFAAIDDAASGLTGEPVRYLARTLVFQPERTFAAAQARAPPRPPGQGPPATLSV